MRRPRECGHYIRIESHITQSENIGIPAHLQCLLDQHQPAPIFFNFEALSQRTHAHARDPDHSREIQFSMLLVMFERNCFFRDTHDARFGMYLDPSFFERVFDELANLFAHAGHQAIGHFHYQHARLAVERAALNRVAQKVGHLG